MKIIKMLLIVTSTVTFVNAGIYSGPSNDPSNPYDSPISKSDETLVSWADVVVDYSPSPGVSSLYQNPATGYWLPGRSNGRTNRKWDLAGIGYGRF